MPPVPDISLVIPVYNGEKHLAAALNSATAQTHGNIEVICVDDHSTDRSLEILKRHAAADRRIRVVAQPVNRGPLAARRAGMLNAAGKYVMFMDADDLLLEPCCKRALTAIRESGCDMVSFGAAALQGGKILEQNNNASVGRLESDDMFKELVNRRICGNVWNKIYSGDLCKKVAAELVDLPADGAMEDFYMIFLFCFFAASYSDIPDVLYIYRLAPEQRSKKVEMVIRSANLIPPAREFLRQHNALETHQWHLNVLAGTFYNACLDALVGTSPLKRPLMEEAIRHWGARISLDYMARKGVLA